MMRVFFAGLAGCLFGAGLAISGMADPQRVRAFLDIFGDWDPTLACVMVGAILPMAIAWRLQSRMSKPVADNHFVLPETTVLDWRLAMGAVLFGIGWAISGLCPGPAIADLAIKPLPAAIFVLAMLAGMVAHKLTSFQLNSKSNLT